MPRNTTALDDRLFLSSLQAPESTDTPLRHRLNELERLFGAAQEEIALLTSERDELVDAIKKWSKADRSERQELLFEATTQELRSEVKQLRSAVKRLKRENIVLHAQVSEPQPRQLRA